MDLAVGGTEAPADDPELTASAALRGTDDDLERSLRAPVACGAQAVGPPGGRAPERGRRCASLWGVDLNASRERIAIARARRRSPRDDDHDEREPKTRPGAQDG